MRNKSRSLTVAIVIVLAAAAALWWGGGALWKLLLAMHGRH